MPNPLLKVFRVKIAEITKIVTEMGALVAYPTIRSTGMIRTKFWNKEINNYEECGPHVILEIASISFPMIGISTELTFPDPLIDRLEEWTETTGVKLERKPGLYKLCTRSWVHLMKMNRVIEIPQTKFPELYTTRTSQTVHGPRTKHVLRSGSWNKILNGKDGPVIHWSEFYRMFLN